MGRGDVEYIILVRYFTYIMVTLCMWSKSENGLLLIFYSTATRILDEKQIKTWYREQTEHKTQQARICKIYEQSNEIIIYY